MIAKKLKNLDQKLVLATLKNVPFDGWQWEALYRGAQDIGLYNDVISEEMKEQLREIFNNDLVEIIIFFNEYLDNEMEKKFLKIKSSLNRTPDKIKKLILLRLNSSLEFKDSVRSSIGYMSLPKNSKKSLKILYKTCDKIWRISGDRSTDFSFYTKRLILSGVYISTMMFWVNDRSKTMKSTENFLDRRLRDVYQLGRLKEKGKILKKNISFPSNAPFKLLDSVSKGFGKKNFTNLINKFKLF